jgi:hypothetical protein
MRPVRKIDKLNAISPTHTRSSAAVLYSTCHRVDPFPEAPIVEHIKLILQYLVCGSTGLMENNVTDDVSA